MRIAIMGSGAIGGYYGARAQEAGHDVAFIARGAHLQAMRSSGLTVESAFGNIVLPTVKATDDTAELDHADLIVFAVKLYDTQAAIEAMVPLVSPLTRIVTLQNGIESVSLLSQAFPQATVIPGLTYLSSVLVAPGFIRNQGGRTRAVIGAAGDSVVQEFAQSMQHGPGVELELVHDAWPEIWEKFAAITAFSGATALMRSGCGSILACEETRRFLLQLRDETLALCAAMGPRLAAGAAERILAIWENLPPQTRASMAHDLAHERRLELDWLSGAVHRLGLQHQVPTPGHSAVYRSLYLYRNGAPTE